jgi:hypothetical protein
MEGIVDLHHDVCFFLITILANVESLLASFLKCPKAVKGPLLPQQACCGAQHQVPSIRLLSACQPCALDAPHQ